MRPALLIRLLAIVVLSIVAGALAARWTLDRRPEGAEPHASDSDTADAEGRVARIVEVVDASGHGVAGARVFLWEDRRLAAGVTDPTGRVAFAHGAGDAGVVIVADRHPPAVERIPAGSVARVVLDRGAALTGRLVVDGAAPPPLALELEIEFGGGDAWIPVAVRDALATYRERITWSDASGRFAIRGLPRRWSGCLRTEPGWAFARDGGEPVRERRLSSADGAVELAILRLPTVSGFVVFADDGAPVPGAHVRVRARFSDGGDSDWRESSTGLDGGFVVDFLRPSAAALDSATVQVRVPRAHDVEAAWSHADLERDPSTRVLAVDRPWVLATARHG